MKSAPQFYVKGYTEALQYYTGVRVVPDRSFMEAVPQKYLFYLGSVQPPYYFVPITSGNDCYGFLLKSVDKKTPRYCTNSLLPGYDRVRDGDVVVFVEGIKDTFLPLSRGMVALPMCTSSVSGGMLEELSKRGCKVIFCPDNDGGREGFVAAFRKKVRWHPIEYAVFNISVKDLGVYFDDSAEGRDMALKDLDKLDKVYDYMGGRRVAYAI